MNKKYIKYLVLAIIVVVALIIIFARKASVKDTKTTEKSENNTTNSDIAEDSKLLSEEIVINEEENELQIEKLIKEYYDMSKKVDENLMDENSKGAQTLKEINKKREGIEAYKNIKTYIKPALEEETYVVFTTYETKFNNIKTLAPGMSVLYVTRDENGEFVIGNVPEDDTELNEHINKLSKEEEIAQVVHEVNTRLKKALKEDKSLNSFVKSLKNISDKSKKEY